MTNRTVKSQSKKAMSTKYSSIGSNLVPLSQQMRNTRSPSSTISKKECTANDNFFDDIMADWGESSNINNNNTKKKNINLGIHQNDDVSSSSSPSLSFTPTPPPSPPSHKKHDRSIYILDNNGQQIPENSTCNYTPNIFDDIMVNDNVLNEAEVEMDETIRNDPNYLPPPQETLENSNNNNNNTSISVPVSVKKKHKKSKDKEKYALPPSPEKTELNPWAHLNKVVTTNITEAPIDDGEEDEDRGFLRHDADINNINNINNKSPPDILIIDNGSSLIRKCCYCFIFIIGIIIGILLTIILIRHEAIDTNYLFGPTSMESESDSVIVTEIDNNMNNSHYRDSYDDENVDIFGHIKRNKHITESPTTSPTKRTRKPTKEIVITPLPTDKPTINPTIKITTMSPTGYPSHSPSTDPTEIITTTSPTHSPIDQMNIIKRESDVISSTLETRDNDNITSILNITSSKIEPEIDITTINTEMEGNNTNKTESKTKQSPTKQNNDTIHLNTTPSPTDYHHIYEGIANSNKQSSVINHHHHHHHHLNSTNTSSPTLYPTPYPSPHPIMESDSLCNVTPKDKCNTNTDILPLPFDKPLSAQLRCHQNTCHSPPSLPGQRIITGETSEAGKTILDIENEIAIQCHTGDFHTIKVERNGYKNNEDWKFCLRISNDNSLSEFPVLHVTFSLIDFDIEQGFDNLFLTTQFDDYYDDYTETWTGTWDSLHRFEPNTWYQNYWMTSSAPNSFSEFCLRLQSDESIIGNGVKASNPGFVSTFSISQEIGIWSEWSECKAHSNSKGIANGACGVGIRSRVSLCPHYIIAPNDVATDDDNRFDWSNDSHSCINKYSNYPINKYCIVANCNDIDNDVVAPIDVITKRKKDGVWNEWRDMIYNGKSRIDPKFADPFLIHPNTNREKINLDELKNNLQSEIDIILSRYSNESQLLFSKVMSYSYPIHFDKLGVRLLSSLLLGRIFTFVTTESSNTAGHDNVFMSAYPMQLQSLMQVIWNKYSIYGGAFRVRDQAIGGHLGTSKQGPCISALIGTYDKNIDMISWESFMNDGSHIPPQYEEIWLRNILLTYGVENEHSQPFITCISTSEGEQSGCLLTGRYLFNSFISSYYNATGIANYFGQHVCSCSKQLDENGKNIPCWQRHGYEACRAPSISWHPSPHRHRVMAETFAVNFMRSAINTIDRLYDDINDILAKNKYLPSYELGCLLEDNHGILSDVDRNHAVFKRPITKPTTKCAQICENNMWCAISFWPTPKHNQLHRYFVDKDGFYNNDTIDLPVDPLIMRNGGRAPIDHKAQWIVDRYKIGAFLEIKVKVPTRYIMIVYPQGTSKIAIATYFAAFQFLVDGVEKKCEKVPYENNINSFCLLDCEKPGKYILKMIIVNDTNRLVDKKKFKVYSIDEIAGI